MIELDADTSYFIGLVTGRGSFDKSNKNITIEFAHKNKYQRGIPYCPKCHSIVKVKREDNPDNKQICDNCGEVHAVYSQTFNQRESVLKSIREILSPLILDLSKKDLLISGNNGITFISANFSNNVDLFYWLVKLFEPFSGYDSFQIPEIIYRTTRENKINFVRGMADCSGFPTWSGWINRNGDRARIYFQIVRNWKLPVQLCNLLQCDLGIPVHTIDWGHPNIRDPNMNEHMEKGGRLTWGREHQIKIFPEYFQEVSYYFYHKKAIFEELVEHNKKLEPLNENGCRPPKKVSKIKIYHNGEKSMRLPLELRNNHFDAYWQVCWKLGCQRCLQAIPTLGDEEYTFITGKIENKEGTDISSIKKRFDDIRTEKRTQSLSIWNKLKEKVTKHDPIKNSSKEILLYDPLKLWLKEHLSRIHGGNVETFDTSSQYLSDYAITNNLSNLLELVETFDIKPDVVASIGNKKDLVFIEAKIVPLSVKEIGQLLGYCLVANPMRALLISTKSPSSSLIRILSNNPELLEYNNRKIEICQWDENKKEMSWSYNKYE